MAAELAAHNDRSTPSPDAAGARAERAMLDVFLWMRLSHLSAGLVSLLVDRRRYRRPGLAAATFAAVAAESVWMTLRARRAESYADPVVAAVDSAVGCAGLLACSMSLHADDQFGSNNWMFPLTLFSTVGASAGFRERSHSVAAVAAFIGTYAAATGARDPERRRQSFFGAFQYAGCFVGGDLLIRRHRANAALIEQAGREAVERAHHVAEARERARLSRDLHTGALSTLEEIRKHWSTDRARARTEARREAIRLRRAIREDDGDDVFDLARRLEDVARDLAEIGMRCELVLDDLEDDPNEEAARAIARAVTAALTNSSEHAGVTTAVVRVTETDGLIEVTIRDRGVGSDRDDCPPSVARPVRQVGGEAQWWSAPGRGARVVLRVAR